VRRKDREVGEREGIEAIIRDCPVCRLALADGDSPYVVPLNFGYREGALYFHSAPTGKKIEILRRNPRVCVEFDCEVEVVKAERPCAFSCRYRSAIGRGSARFVEDPLEKGEALNLIVGRYGGPPGGFTEAELASVAVVRVDFEELTGKRSGRL